MWSNKYFFLQVQSGNHVNQSSGLHAPATPQITIISPSVSLRSVNSPSKFLALREKSCSRINFAWKLTQEFCTIQEMITSNTRGVRREMLNPDKMAIVKGIVFHWFPLQRFESEYKTWRDCQKGIDKSIRHFRTRHPTVDS